MILLAGADGQVGKELRRLASSRALALLPLGRKELDITDERAVHRTVRETRPRLVVNAAAHTAVDQAETEKELAGAVNCAGPAYLAAACDEAGVPLLHLSTDYVFDGEKSAPYEEEDPCNPVSEYGRSKAAGEEAVRRCLQRHVILRTSWVFSSHGHNFVKTMLRLGADRKELSIVDDQTGGPTAASDIAEAILSLAERLQREGSLPWGTYHFCGTPPITWRGFAEEIFRQAAAVDARLAPRITPITTDQYPTPAKRPQNSVLSCEKIRESFSIEQPDWRVSLRCVIRDLLQQGE